MAPRTYLRAGPTAARRPAASPARCPPASEPRRRSGFWACAASRVGGRGRTGRARQRVSGACCACRRRHASVLHRNTRGFQAAHLTDSAWLDAAGPTPEEATWPVLARRPRPVRPGWVPKSKQIPTQSVGPFWRAACVRAGAAALPAAERTARRGRGRGRVGPLEASTARRERGGALYTQRTLCLPLPRLARRGTSVPRARHPPPPRITHPPTHPGARQQR